ncbi:MAG: DUF2232 domain-containing protein [bacterium]
MSFLLLSVALCFLNISVAMFTSIGLPLLVLLPTPLALAVQRKGVLATILAAIPGLLAVGRLYPDVWPVMLSVILLGIYLGWEVSMDIEPSDILWQGTIFAAGLFLLWTAWSMHQGNSIVFLWIKQLDIYMKPENLPYLQAFDAEQRLQMFSELKRTIMEIYPSLLLIYLTLLVIANLWLTRKLLPFFGERLKPYLPFEFWRIAHPVVWGIIIGILFVFAGIEWNRAALHMLGVNLFISFSLPYLICGLGIISLQLRRMQAGDLLRRLLLLLCILQPFLIQAALWLGVFDTWCDFRKLEALKEN